MKVDKYTPVVPKYTPVIEIRKPWWNCWRDCPGCLNAVNFDYGSFDLTDKQVKLLNKLLSAFEVNLDDKDIYWLWLTFPFPFNKLSLDTIKNKFDEYNLDKVASLSFMISNSLEDFSTDIGWILEKLKYIFDTNIEKTWFKKNWTLTLSSSKWWLDQLIKNKDLLTDPLIKLMNSLEEYVKYEFTLQLWRLVIDDKDYLEKQLKSKELIENINNNLNIPNSLVDIIEWEDYSEYNIVVDIWNDKSYIIHLGLVRKTNDKESVWAHIEHLKDIYSYLLLSFLDNEVQLNHSLWRFEDKINRFKYDELYWILDEMSDLKEKLQLFNMLDAWLFFNYFSKIIIIKSIALKKNIKTILNSNNFNDFEKNVIFETYNIMKKDKISIKHIEKWLFPIFVIWVYMRLKLMNILSDKVNNNSSK